MFKRILTAMAGLALALPVSARIEDGTLPLMQTIRDAGIVVKINSQECADGTYSGLYIHRGLQRAFVVCPGAEVTAYDHSVVRHEAWHAVQHCINTARGTNVWQPVIQDEKEFNEFIAAFLTPEKITKIKRMYPYREHRLELEAFAAMDAFTSAEIDQYFRKACIWSDDN